MANPSIQTLPINAITQVATNVETGIIWTLDEHDIKLLHTYRETGDADTCRVKFYGHVYGTTLA